MQHITDSGSSDENVFFSIFENIVDGIAISDIKTKKICLCNQAFSHMLGYSREEVLSLVIYDFHPAGLKVFVDTQFDKINNMEPLLIKDVPVLRKNGTIFYADITASTVMFKGTAHLVATIRDITDRKMSEKALEESEKHLSELNKMIHLGHWTWDIKSGSVEWSDEVYKIFHLDPETFKPHINSIIDMSPWPEYHERGKELIKIATETHQTGTYEQRFLRPDNSIGYYQSSFQGRYDENGELTSIFGSILDITERKLAEEQLKNNEAMLKSIFDASPAGIALLVDRIFKKINYSLCRVTGYEEKDLIGKSTRLLYESDEDFQSIAKAYTKLHTEKVVTTESRLQTKDGREIHVLISLSPLNPHDFSAGIIASILDITERKLAEEALIKSEATLKSLFDATPVGLGLLQHDNFLKVNKALCNITLYSENELLGSNVSSLFYDKKTEARRVMHEMQKQIVTEGIGITETSIKNKNQESVKVMLFLSPFNKEDIFQGMTISILDVSEISKIRSEKTHLEEMLLHSQKLESIGKLAGGIAHDFNNLLVAIMGNTEMALEQLDPDSDIYKSLKVVMDASEGAANLTRQLLAFSRKQIIAPKVLDLNAILERVRKMINTLIGESISLEIICATDLDSIMADTGQIEQIIMNLSANARDAMPDGGNLIITTSNVKLDEYYSQNHVNVAPGNYVMISFADTGFGMSKEIQEHIFEPFYTTKEPGKGTGLGLSTVYGIIKQSNGSIELYSEIGKGTTFKLYFPSIKHVTTIQDKESEQKQDVSGKETILLAEDNIEVLEFSSIVLRKYGYRVLTACSGEDAIKIAADYNGQIDLFITDVILPGINGRIAAEKIVSIRNGIKVLYNSGYTAEIIDKQGILDEGINFISKPFTSRELLIKVRNILDNK